MVAEQSPKNSGFTSWTEIKNFEDFADRGPMSWIPRKEEIARILYTAHILQKTRIVREKGSPNTISILDIGGGHGALGKLLVDLAGEWNLNVQVLVVDPSSELISAASDEYARDNSLSFVCLSARDFLNQLYDNRESSDWSIFSKDKKIARLLTDRDNLIFKGQRKLDAYKEYVSSILEITRFGELKERTRVFVIEYDRMFGKEKKRIDRVTEKIEKILLKMSPKFDLVINSWMSPFIDFTKEIRAANGAGIVYAIQPWGASGIQKNANILKGKIDRLDQEDSYGIGNMYAWQEGWVGQSLAEIREGGIQSPGNQFGNAVMIQTRKDFFSANSFECAPINIDFRITGKYPWENELEKKYGPIQETFPMKKAAASGNYNEDLMKFIG